MNSHNSQDRVWPFARGSGVTILISLVAWLTAVIGWFWFTNIPAGIWLFLTTFLLIVILYFFRDPNRAVINEPGQVIGPGDGEVVEISQVKESSYLNEEAIRVSMFLNVTDVHVQRAPIGGRVTQVVHKPGKFLQAFRPEASEINEHIAMVIETVYGRILIKQIAGILARRCVNYTSVGQAVHTGERFGLIRFGSRLDLFLPVNAKLQIKVGDIVVGGVTPIAQLFPETTTS